MNSKRRLERLEARTPPIKTYEAPTSIGAWCTAVARERAHKEGKPLPPYTREELRQMHENDVADACGDGVVGCLLDDPGWQSKEAQATLTQWQAKAAERVQQVKAGMSLKEAYEHD